MDEELIESLLYKLKMGSYYYASDEKMKSYILNALLDTSDTLFYKLLKDFVTQGLDEIDALRLHLAFRREINSGRYQKQKDLYDLFIEHKEIACQRMNELVSLL